MSTRVAILAASAERCAYLQDVLEAEGLSVVHVSGLSAASLLAMDRVSPNVLLVDLNGDLESEIELIDGLMEHSSLPVMFNDSSPEGSQANARWARRLAKKLLSMAETEAFQSAGEVAAADVLTVDAMASEQMPVSDQAARDQMGLAGSGKASQDVVLPEGAAENVWVLGASLGGPQAVREFLEAIDGDLPVAFVLVQHIGANHVQLLAEQLNRVSDFKVLPARLGHVLRHGEVLLAPADKHLQLTDDGYVSLTKTPADAVYLPSIDHVMQDLAARYGERAGAIVFSGMGNDGAEGCAAVARQGGIVWAQDVKSCVISSMPDQARKTGTVTYSANPPAIAQHLYDYYQEAD